MFASGHTSRVQHPLAVDPDAEPEPDVAAVRGGPRDHLADHPREALLIVEVAESSLAFDQAEKARLYARAGVGDYWIVNLIDRRVEVHRNPGADGYRSVSVLTAADEVSPLAAPSSRIPVASLLP